MLIFCCIFQRNNSIEKRWYNICNFKPKYSNQMKKLNLTSGTIVLLLSLIIGNKSFAQSESGIDTRQLKIGAFVAPTLSWMHPTTSVSDNGEFETSSLGSKLGFTYGIMFDYNFAPNYAIVTGLQVNMTGGKVLATNLEAAANSQVRRADFSYNLNYLEIPLAIKLKSNDVSGFRFFGQAGISLGFNIAKKADYTVDFINDLGESKTGSGTKEKIKGTLAVAPIMLAMDLGIGTEYELSQNMRAYVGVFFHNGFLPDATKPGNYKMNKYDNLSFKDGNVRLNNMSLRLGVYF